MDNVYVAESRMQRNNTRSIMVPINKIKEAKDLPWFSSNTPDLHIDDNERKSLDDEKKRARTHDKLDQIAMTFEIPKITFRDNIQYDFNDIKAHIYEIAKAISILSNQTRTILTIKKMPLLL